MHHLKETPDKLDFIKSSESIYAFKKNHNYSKIKIDVVSCTCTNIYHQRYRGWQILSSMTHVWTLKMSSDALIKKIY